MTPDEYATIQRLSRCSFLPGSFPKRFARSLVTLGPYDLLSVRQSAALWTTAWRYRRQIGEAYARPTGVVSSEVAAILVARGWGAEDVEGGCLVYPKQEMRAVSERDRERLRAWNAGEKL